MAQTIYGLRTKGTRAVAQPRASAADSPAKGARKLRSGKEFSPFAVAAFTAAKGVGFDFAHATATAIATEDELVGNCAPDHVLDDAVQDAANEVVDDAINDDGAYTDDAVRDDGACNDVAIDGDEAMRDDDAIHNDAAIENDDAMHRTGIDECAARTNDATHIAPDDAPMGGATADATPTDGTTSDRALPLPPRTNRKASRLSKEKRRKAAKKALKQQVKPALLLRHLEAAAGGHQTILAADDMPHTTTGYQGLRGGKAVKRSYGLEELVGTDSKLGMELKRWDGITPIPILDELCRIFGVCSGQPRDERWPEVTRSASAAISKARSKFSFPAGSMDHRRGNFPATAVGVSFGGGQQVPGNLVHPDANQAILDGLLREESITRVAHFGSDSFKFWQPRLHQYYTERLGRLYARYPRLRRNFRKSVFPCATFNFGPKTCCYPHVDCNNLPYGMCAITALGDYDPKRGGHLVLWDLKLVIEFPPGSTILIPSACIRHSNVSIQEGETRYSFTQYAAGGLFRWVDHGFQSEKVYRSGWSKKRKREELAVGRRRWEEAMELFPTLEELRSVTSTA